MQPYADAEGHILLQPAAYPDPFKCFKESETDKLRRVEEANSMLATLQQVLDEVSMCCVPTPTTHFARAN